MFAEIFNLVVDTLAALYVMLILMRFVLQLSRADFYNPISQFVVKATNPLVIPLRRVIPGLAGIDLASLVLAIVVQGLAVTLKVVVLEYAVGNPLNIALLAAIMVASALIKLYFWSLIIMIVSSWIAPGSSHPALQLVNQITEPLMKPFRSILPSMGGLDLSPILVFLTLQVLETVVSHLMRMI